MARSLLNGRRRGGSFERPIIGGSNRTLYKKSTLQVFVTAIYAGLRQNELALNCLEQAYEDRCSWLLRCVAADPRLNRLREESRFHELARRLGVSHVASSQES